MNALQPSFAEEVARVRQSGALGHSGRLRDLFDFLAARGPAGEPATQADIAETVFGQSQTEVDDATARVYIHRLRKRLEQFYGGGGGEHAGGRLVIPAGAYALRFEREDEPEAGPSRRAYWLRPGLVLFAITVVAALVAAFFVGRVTGASATASEVNAIWRPFVESNRPLVIAVGDYYMYGQFSHGGPDVDRLIRDYAINSKTDLARAQAANPARYGNSGDVGLSYLPVSSAYALRWLVPIVAQHGKHVSVLPASQIDSSVFRTSDVIYVGLISGMGLLRDVNFTDSNFAVGESYDELIDMESGKRFVSGETFALPTANYYEDYGYIARFRQPGGALVGVIAGERDTSLRGMAPLAVGKLPEELAVRAANGSFEALYQITGQQGADLGEKLVEVRQRP
ncbi:MAG: winged helix-turn-helix domain-containing protein [Porphyrobacter sp.]|nr:winged helix-turn-helix domain-containing protein [Porphyrobacter sp.]